jgi:hypothetical protein
MMRSVVVHLESLWKSLDSPVQIPNIKEDRLEEHYIKVSWFSTETHETFAAGNGRAQRGDNQRGNGMVMSNLMSDFG